MVASKKNDNSQSIEKCSVEKINAESLIATKIGAKSINAGKADLDHSGVGYLRAVEVTQNNCGNAVVVAKNLKTSSVKSLVTIADNVEGDVQTVLDKEGAIHFGLAFAGIMLLFRLLKRIFR